MAAATSRQWLVFELSDQAYGFDINHVREIVSLREMAVHRMPQTPDLIEGVVLLRDRPIEVVDVRSAVGMCPLHEETEGIVKTLCEREADHCRWIEELEACVNESREFRMATDPHKCKFGQWYDQIRTDREAFSRLTAQDLALTSMIEQLDQPHKRIHAIAHRVTEHVVAGRISEARRIIDETRDTELRSLKLTFARCREQIELVRRGLMLVFDEDGGNVGGIVDRVCEVTRLSEDDVLPVGFANLGKGMLVGLAERRDTGKMIQLLDVPAIARLRQRDRDTEVCSVA